MLRKLPQDIVRYITMFIPLGDQIEIQEFLDPLQVNILHKKINWIKYFIPRVIHDIMGIKMLLDTPFLEWKDEFLGLSDYIEYIRPCHVNSPVMMGVDKYDRAFLAIRTQSEHKIYVDTIFQLYSNDHYSWTHGFNGTTTWLCSYRKLWYKNDIINRNLEHLLKYKYVNICHGLKNHKYIIC